MMQRDPTTVTDIWFRCDLPLLELATALGLAEVEHDSEDHWEWVIGRFGDSLLDITRTHTRPPATVDTRIFRLDKDPFTADQRKEVVRRIRRAVPGPVTCGRWVYLQGDEFDLQVVETD